MRNEIFPLLDAVGSHLNLEITRHGLTKGDPSWNQESAPVEWNRLYWMISGSARVSHKGHGVDLVPGRVYLLPGGFPYRLEAKGTFQKFFLQFRVSLPSGRDLFRDAPEPVIRSRPYGAWRSLVKQFGGSGGEIFEAKARVLTLLSRFYRDMGLSVDLKHDAVMAHRYKDLLAKADSLPFRDWDFTRWAREENRSLASLSRSFHRDLGMSLTAYFRRRLMRRACDLLVLGDEPVSTVARRLGFDDESYFGRLFRKELWCSPREWRSANRLGQERTEDRHH